MSQRRGNHVRWLATLIPFALLAGACGSKKSTDLGTGEQTIQTVQKKSIDLSTEEQAIRTIHRALLDGDKETFRKCVSDRILKRIGDRFDSWFEVWKQAANRTPVEAWIKRPIKMVNEGGSWRLDEM